MVGVCRPTLQILTLDHISDQYLLGNVRKYQGIFVSENERYQIMNLVIRGGGHSREFEVGVCCEALQILTLELISDQYL